MKKAIAAVLLVALFAFGLAPAAVFAAPEPNHGSDVSCAHTSQNALDHANDKAAFNRIGCGGV